MRSSGSRGSAEEEPWAVDRIETVAVVRGPLGGETDCGPSSPSPIESRERGFRHRGGPSGSRIDRARSVSEFLRSQHPRFQPRRPPQPSVDLAGLQPRRDPRTPILIEPTASAANGASGSRSKVNGRDLEVVALGVQRAPIAKLPWVRSSGRGTVPQNSNAGATNRQIQRWPLCADHSRGLARRRSATPKRSLRSLIRAVAIPRQNPDSI